MKGFLFYLFEAVVIFAFLAVLLSLPGARFEVPFVFEGDAMHHLMIAKSIITSGWWWNISSLSAPFGLKMIEFPVGGTLDYFLMLILSVGIRTPGALVNAFWLLSIILAGLSATWCLTRLRGEKPVAFALGIVFALIPHIYYRNVSHLMLVTYLVPFVVTTAALFAAGRWSSLPRRDRTILVVACGLTGLNYVYTSFFSVLLLTLGAFLGYVRGRDRRELVRAVGIACLLSAVTAANVFPTLVAWRGDPKTKAFMAAFKSANESETSGLKLRHLITPRPDHFIPVLRRFQAKLDRSQMPLENENVFARLGMVPSFGFLALLLISIASVLTQGLPEESLLSGLAGLNLGLFLFCTIGGFGALFNVFISPSIRCYNRASMFIAFLGCACVAMLLSRLKVFGRTEDGRYAYPGLALLAALAIFAAEDQNAGAAIVGLRSQNEARYDARRVYLTAIEKVLPANASIYEMPFTDYPVTPNLVGMRADEYISFYVESTRKDLRWSWPALSIDAHEWNRQLERLPAEKLAARVAADGFSAICVDRAGYEDHGKRVEAGLREMLGAPRVVSQDGRYALYLERTGR